MRPLPFTLWRIMTTFEIIIPCNNPLIYHQDMKKTLLSLMLFAAVCLPSWATVIGYSNGNIYKYKMLSVGESSQQGMAIKLPTGKIRALQGHTIRAIQAVFGSLNTTNGKAK